MRLQIVFSAKAFSFVLPLVVSSTFLGLVLVGPAGCIKNQDVSGTKSSTSTQTAFGEIDTRLLDRKLLVAGRKPITFGLELEVNLKFNPRLVEIYRPASFTESQWLRLSTDERLKKGLEWDAKVAKDYKIISYLRLTAAGSIFPEKIKTESNGFSELNGFVFSTLGELVKFLESFEARFGPAFSQGHVVFPATPISGVTGFIIHQSDYALLRTLMDEVLFYRSNPSRLPAANLVSHSLPPLYEENKTKLLALESTLERGEKIPYPGDETKHILAPTLRGDTYPNNLVGFELRQWDMPSGGGPILPKRSAGLVQSMAQTAQILSEEGNFKRFEKYKSVQLLSALNAGTRLAELRSSSCLTDEVKSQVSKIDPKVWADFLTLIGSAIRAQDPHIDFGPLTTNIRFYVPFRDWKSHPALSFNQEQICVLDRATSDYAIDIQALSKKNGLAPADILKEARLLVATWTEQTKLVERYALDQVQSIAR
jgi:hypothetical protein